MFKRIISKAALDGFLHAFLLLLLNNWGASSWAANWSVEGCMLIVFGTAPLSAAGYVLLIHREESSRCIAGISLLSVVFCLLTLIGGVVWMIEFPVRLLPVREGNAGDGLLLIIMAAAYLFIAGVLRVLAWIALGVRCWIRSPEDRQP